MEIRLTKSLLRPLTENDAASIAHHANNRNVWRNLRNAFPQPYSKQDALEFIGRINEQPGPPVLAIEVDGLVVGTVGVRLKEDIETGSAEVGYWLGEEYWGRGITSEAVKAIVDYALSTYELHRLDAWVYAWNPASARVLEKCGFQLEGVARRSAIKDGQITDRWLYAYLPDGAGNGSSNSSGARLSS